MQLDQINNNQTFVGNKSVFFFAQPLQTVTVNFREFIPIHTSTPTFEFAEKKKKMAYDVDVLLRYLSSNCWHILFFIALSLNVERGTLNILGTSICL